MALNDEEREALDRLLALNEELTREVAGLHKKCDALNERLIYREKWLVGWDEIGAHVGYSASRAQALSGDEEDPLPYVKFGHLVHAKATELDAWKERRRVRVKKTLSEQRTGRPKKRMVVSYEGVDDTIHGHAERLGLTYHEAWRLVRGAEREKNESVSSEKPA